MLSVYIKDKDRIYPLFALISGTLLFLVGLFFVKTTWFHLYLLSIFLLLIAFGYLTALLKVMCLIVPVSIFVTLLAMLGTNYDNAIQNGLRAFLLGLCSVITLSIEPVDLVRNLNQFKVPRVLTLGLLITLRFISVMAEEMKRIRIAMQTRGVNSNLLNPKVLYRAFLIPLIMRVISISDILAVSLDTRCFNMDGENSIYKRLNVDIKSIIFLSISIIIILVSLYFKFAYVKIIN